MELTNLIQDMPTDQPRLRVYGTHAIFNSVAVRLLELKPGDYVRFSKPRIHTGNKTPIYVGKTTNINGAFRVFKKDERMRVNGTALMRKLQESLDGPGCYRICPEDSVTENGETQYNIFFRKYDKKDTD